MKRYLVYYIGQASRENSLQSEMLKNLGPTVHNFDSIELMFDAIRVSLPDLIVVRFCVTSPYTLQIIDSLKKYSQVTGVDLSILILIDSFYNPQTISLISGLPLESFLQSPVAAPILSKKILQLIEHPPGYVKEKVVLWDPEKLLGEIYGKAFKDCGYSFCSLERMPDEQTIMSLHPDVCLVLAGSDNNLVDIQELLHKKTWTDDLRNVVLIVKLNDQESKNFYLPSNVLCHCFERLSPVRLMQSIQNIFHQNQLQEILVEADVSHSEISSRERLYRRVVESQDDLMCKMMPDSSLTFVNKAFSKLTAKPRRDLTNRRMIEFIPSQDIPTFRTAIQQMAEHRLTQTYEHGVISVNQTNNWYLWTGIPVLDGMGNVVEILTAGRDITEKRLLEIQLMQESQEQDLLLSSIPTHVWYLTDENTYGRVNQAHAAFLGRSVSDVSNKPINQILTDHDVSMLVKLYYEVKTSRSRIYSEFQLTNFDNQRRLMAINAVPQLDSRGIVTSIVCSALDVTQQRVSEFALAYRAEFEHLINEVSATFLQHDSRHLYYSITSSLEKIAKFTGANRAFLSLTTEAVVRDGFFIYWQAMDDDGGVQHPDMVYGSIKKRLRNQETVLLENPSMFTDLEPEDQNYLKCSGAKSALYLPLEMQDLFMGYIGFESMDQEIAWTEDILVLLRFYSRILLQTVQRQVAIDVMEKEHDLGIKLNKSQSLENSLNLCLEHALAVSGMECGGIYIYDELQNELILTEHQGLTPEFVASVYRFSGDSRRFEALKKGPIFTDALNYGQFSDEHMIKEGIKSIGVLPVMDGQSVMACVNVASRIRETIPSNVRSALIAMISRLGPAISRARIEDEIRRNWENLNLLLNSIKDYIFVFDLNGKILHFNQSVTEHLEYTADDLDDLTIQDVFLTDSDEQILQDLVSSSNNQPEIFEHLIRHRDETIVPVETHVVKSKWRQTNVCFTFCHDLTRIKEAEGKRLDFEKQLQQARKVESLGRMAGAIAHRFNNLLMGVSGNLELAQLIYQRKNDPTEKISIAKETAKKATELSKLMLTYVGQGVTEQHVCNLSKEIEPVLPLIRSSVNHNIKILVQLTEKLPLIKADSNGLRQIVMNLASNSWESITDEYGSITIETGLYTGSNYFDLNLIDPDVEALPSCVFLKISDTGCGMNPEDIKEIFDPFYSTKFTGRGLGLSTVQGIVKAHNGYISVITKPDRGTEVTILLPIPEEPCLPRPNGTSESIDAVNKLKNSKHCVLFVDDEVVVRNLGKSMLSESGFQVILASSGEEAIEIYRESVDRISCIICDLFLFEMNGWDVLREVRRINPDSVFILASGFEIDKQSEGIPDIPSGYIQKPYSIDKILQVLNTVL